MDGEREVAPFLTVLKGDEVIDKLCLDGQTLLVMGRHHSCDLVVGHASSSRQHVEIQLIYATREILLTDLCSVHGTRIDGKRLASMTPTLSKESVTFQLGESTRVYRIDWQPVPEPEQSSESASDTTSCSDGAQDIFSLSGSRSALGGLCYADDDQDYMPSAPYAPGFDHLFVQQEENSSPAARSSSSKRSPAKLGELRKSLSSPKTFYQDENLSPVVRNSPVKHGYLTRSLSSPTRPLRRLAFSTLQPSATNAQSPRSPSVKKVLVERSGSSGSLKTTASPKISRSPRSPSVKKALVERLSSVSPKIAPSSNAKAERELPTPSKLWLRRCSSAPLPVLATGVDTSRVQAPKLSALNEEQEVKYGTVDRSVSRSSRVSSSQAESGDAEYPPNKENMNPKSLPPKASSRSIERTAENQGGTSSRNSSIAESIAREPFRPLHFTTLDVRPVFHQLQSRSIASSEEDHGSKALGLPRPKFRTSTTAQSLDQMLRKLKLGASIEGRRQWHVVIDTNCLIDSNSLKALKQLEGIREICVIVPKIVVRELDSLKQRQGLRSSARLALKWIESCMVKLPTWIHVQSSTETLPVRPTPPSSPSTAGFTHHGDLMSPTNDDHILECALIFAATVRFGKVALLTKDTALKIKAMAEGLVSESAPEFCESLLSPYSSRFLWSGSTAHGKTWADRSADNSPAPSYPGDLRFKSFVKHSLEDLHHHVDAQPRGLKLVVQ